MVGEVSHALFASIGVYFIFWTLTRWVFVVFENIFGLII